MYQIRIEISFDSGHRLLDYQGRCAFPHGHSYKAELFVGSGRLDPRGLIIDFAELKEKLKGWVDSNWDHGFLLNSRDQELLTALRSLSKSKLYVFQGENPSAEVMARELYERARELWGVDPLKVRLWESPSQYAEFHGGDAG